ncbi:carbonate dehydratase [soil metagenome]
MSETNELLDGNRNWVNSITRINPRFFEELSKLQNPEYLWIGCSDSRVPANQITDTLPGAIFVHRNIANVVQLTDYNMLSVVFYAVKHLKVKHIIVCGHYGCGGVLAAMSKKSFGFIDGWLSNIKNVQRLHQEQLDALQDDQARADRLVELNVMEGVRALSSVSFIQEEWQKEKYPKIHGWVYSLNNGYINDLNVTADCPECVSEMMRYEMEGQPSA